jgi:DNA invertase Pin-like site-specific DNA recombinase
MTHCVLYSRVSTYKQVQVGLSLEAQEETLLKWASLKGMEIIPRKSGLKIWAERGRSGKNVFGRPVLMEAMKKACEEKAVLVTLNLTRLARSIQDVRYIAETLMKAGGGLQLVQQPIDTTTATGRLHMGIIALFAEFEREITSERVMEVNTWKRQHNLRVAGPEIMYGFRAEPTTLFGRRRQLLVPKPDQQDVIRRIVEWREMGRAIKWICRRLNIEKVPTGVKRKKGTGQPIWYPSLVKRILKRNQNHQMVGTSKAEAIQKMIAS